MKIEQLLEKLDVCGIRLSAVEGRLSCSAPKGTLTPDLQAALGEHKSALLARLQDGGAAIPRLSRAEPLPLSTAQQRLWLLDRLEGESSRYNLVAASRIRGAVNLEVLQRALRYVVERHEILHTYFVVVDDEPRQMIGSTDAACTVDCDDISSLSEPDRATALTAALSEESRFHFDLGRLPLMRTRLLRLTADEHVLICNQHHIITDGWSRNIFARELMTAYAAFDAGQVPVLPALPAQYADFSVWQKQDAARRMEVDIDFWRAELANLPALLSLPTDFPRPARQTYRGVSLPVRVDAALTGQLTQLSRQHGVSLFMLLQAVLRLCLYRHSGARDIAIGIPVAGRNHPDAENLVGCFMNSLVLRCELDEMDTFSAFLKAVKARTLRALDHPDVPFEKLVGALQVRRDLSYSPLFQVMFSFLSQGDSAWPAGSPEIEDLDVAPQQVLFDLDWQLRESDGRISGYMTYASDLFCAERAAAMVANFLQALQAVVRMPDLPLGEIDILPAAERRRLLQDWNGTAADYPRGKRVQELFQAQVIRTPEAIAVSGNGQHWSYRELDRRANAIAHRLRDRGIGPGSRVGICLGRTPRTLAALLGILKAGAAYVPLDPLFPAERLAFMLADSGAALILSDASVDADLRERLAAVTPMVLLDKLSDVPMDSAPVLPPATPQDVMYLIYTSGSTGQPKGVVLGHGSVINFLTSMAERPGITAHDTLLAVTTLSFDIAVLELFLPILNGARVVLADQSAGIDPTQLMRLLEDENVTVMQATPSTWRLLLAAGWTGKSDLTVLCGGEALPCDLSQRLLPCCQVLWNMYGPTETTVWSTLRRITADTVQGGERNAKPNTIQNANGVESIGRPIANTQLYILDPQRRLLPTGAVGELWIGGDGLALEYHARPQLSAERFITDPYAGRVAARMYGTGDQARWRSDGNVEFLGRLDQQVKLRGYRIELGEIEAVLGQHPAVAHCAVLIREDRPGDPRLTAYVVAGAVPPEAAELRRHLRLGLPEYMLPAAFVFLPAMPLTPNGKIDRAHLPPPEAATSAADSKAPADALEGRIAALWEAVLNTPVADVNANFFDFGGHSLLVINLHQRLKAVFGGDFEVLDLFRHATVRSQAGLIAGLGPTVAPNDAVQTQAARQRLAFQRQRALMQGRADR